ncbi:MAG: sugar transferase [Oleispira sp.]|nr:sugar transferase [Oleispira sp.]
MAGPSHGCSPTAQKGGLDVKQVIKGDQRMTKVGFWLRRASLDELSLVGPARPCP